MNLLLTCSFRAPVQALSLALALQLAGIPAIGQTIPTALSVVVVQGEGDSGAVRQRAPRPPAVRVVDEAQHPLAGAAVIFTLPTEGATGAFPNGAKTLMVLTDDQGMATAQGLRFNQIPGRVPVDVNVSYRGLTAHSSITETSTAPAGYKASTGGHTGRLVTILLVLAAGGAGGAYYATRKNGNSNSSPNGPTGAQPIGITAGSPTLSSPK